MSGNGKNGDLKTTERVVAQAGPGRGMGGGQIAQKPLAFKESGKRLLNRLRPQRLKVTFVLLAAIVSVGLASLGPRVLGRATDLIFAGAIGGQLPAGMTKQQAVDAAVASGDRQIADMLSGVDIVPGTGIDFGAVGTVLLIVVALYAGSALLSFLQGYLLNDVVQATVMKLRAEVEDKIHRLPLSYFDRQPRGELLSRVTNDIDNVSQSLQQTMSQLLSSLLTVLFVVTMMFLISPTLALIALVTIPITMVVAALVMKRSQKHFVTQWRRTGTLNAQVEEAFTGHSLVKVFGRQDEVQEAFEAENEQLYEASFSAQFLSGLIMPIMMFIGNLNYVIIAVIGGLRVTSGTMSLGDVQAFIQYFASVHPSGYTDCFDGEFAPIGSRISRTSLRAARRGGRGANRPSSKNGRQPSRSRGVRGRLIPLRTGPASDRGPLDGGRARANGCHCWTYGCRKDNSRKSAHAFLRTRRRSDHPRRSRYLAHAAC